LDGKKHKEFLPMLTCKYFRLFSYFIQITVWKKTGVRRIDPRPLSQLWSDFTMNQVLEPFAVANRNSVV
jgi:hypothetical protein